jgi:hypothetical protein
VEDGSPSSPICRQEIHSGDEDNTGSNVVAEIILDCTK